MALFNSPTDVIIEAANLDMKSAGDISLESAISAYNTEYDSIPTLEEGIISYTEEVVPVFGYNDMAVVELESVVKFMESQNIEDIETAMKMIAEHYEIEDLGIVIESDCKCKEKDDDDDDDDFEDDFEESCANRNKNKATKKELKVATESLISLKNKGFKLFKKPDKKKAKKKKKKC